jgi:biopolymer transport protein ExbD
MRLTQIMPQKTKPEPSLPLINIVFLMLIFFLIAGTLAPPLDQDLTLVRTSDLEGREPPDALIAHADGSLSFRGNETTIEAYMSDHDDRETSGNLAVRIVPDQSLPAVRLVEIGEALQAAGAARVFIVTERSLEPQGG